MTKITSVSQTTKAPPDCPHCGKPLVHVTQIWVDENSQQHAFDAGRGQYKRFGPSDVKQEEPSTYECKECGHAITPAYEIWKSLQELGAT